jgi:mannosyltransferase OCH1-like enzyme
MSIKEKIVPTLNRTPACAIVDAVPFAQTIPRIIHQTFYERTLAPQLAANVAHLKQVNPGWEYRFYDDADIVRFITDNYNAAVVERFGRIDSKYGAARADVFRYLLMYKVGGVYLDIKSLATRPLDDVLHADDRFVLSGWNNDMQSWGSHYELRDIPTGEFQQWHIVCAPGHPFLKAVLENVMGNIDKYLPSLHGVGKNGVLRVTGPIAYTRAIHAILDRHPHRIADSQLELGFEYNVYRNQSHETAFKSHYSQQTTPLIQMAWAKRLQHHGFAVVQFVYDVITGRRRKMARAEARKAAQADAKSST